MHFAPSTKVPQQHYSLIPAAVSFVCLYVHRQPLKWQAKRSIYQVFIVDATHSSTQTSSYDGVHIQLVGKDGNQENTLLAVGFIPKENICNMAWFVEM
jgi:hypothetical protein